MTTSHQLINQTSGEVEWFTPVKIIIAARECMGMIDLDPASCAKANREIVGANQIFTKESDGLSKCWTATTVWLNHPFGRKSTTAWIDKLLYEFEAKNFDQACTITYASTSERWFRSLLRFPQCFIHGRTNYISAETMKSVKGASKGSVVTYLGPKGRTGNFARAFSKLGTVKVEYI
jgi:ParB family chromosome partitioning protein